LVVGSLVVGSLVVGSLVVGSLVVGSLVVGSLVCVGSLVRDLDADGGRGPSASSQAARKPLSFERPGQARAANAL
jgi:hypothetical protein